jgi:hypothetical protein
VREAIRQLHLIVKLHDRLVSDWWAERASERASERACIRDVTRQLYKQSAEQPSQWREAERETKIHIASTNESSECWVLYVRCMCITGGPRGFVTSRDVHRASPGSISVSRAWFKSSSVSSGPSVIGGCCKTVRVRRAEWSECTRMSPCC